LKPDVLGLFLNTFYTLGRCKIKCLNCHFQHLEKNNFTNTLEGSVLTFSPTIFWIKACYHSLGCICKFVLRHEKFNMMGPMGTIAVWAVKPPHRPMVDLKRLNLRFISFSNQSQPVLLFIGLEQNIFMCVWIQ
jgi:hypothetical protein